MILNSKFSLYFGTLAFIAIGFVGGVALADPANEGPAEEEVFTLTVALKEEAECEEQPHQSIVECQISLNKYRISILNDLKAAFEAGGVEEATFAPSPELLPSGSLGLLMPRSDSGLNYQMVSTRLHQILEAPQFALVEAVFLESEFIPVNYERPVPWQVGATVGAVAGFLYALAFSALSAISTVSRQRRKQSD